MLRSMLLLLVFVASGCSLLFEVGEDDLVAQEGHPDGGVDSVFSCGPSVPLAPQFRGTVIDRTTEDYLYVMAQFGPAESETTLIVAMQDEDVPGYQLELDSRITSVMLLTDREMFAATGGELTLTNKCSTGVSGSLRAASFRAWDSETGDFFDKPACEFEVSVDFDFGAPCP